MEKLDLQQRLERTEKDRDMFHRAEMAWEKTMMETIGEDGVGSVKQAIERLQSERTALQEQVQKLAAENVVLKDFSWSEAVSYDMEKQDRWMMECTGARDRYREMKTPATDAVIREIGAKAVEDAAEKAPWLYGDQLGRSVESIPKEQLLKWAATLRAAPDAEEELKTPATDAVIREIGAKAVAGASDELKQLAKRSDPVAAEHMHSAALYLMLIATQLRAGDVS